MWGNEQFKKACIMKTVETFLSVPGYEGLYEVSNLGNVKSLRSGKLMKRSLTSFGYEMTTLSKDGKQKTYLIHRLVALTFIPNPENLEEINHKDEVKTNNSVENLEWCTRKYNLNYGTYRERMSALKTGKPNPRKNKIQVEVYDPVAKVREEIRKEKKTEPFWKRSKKEVDEFVEWSKVMDALGGNEEDLVNEGEAILEISF